MEWMIYGEKYLVRCTSAEQESVKEQLNELCDQEFQVVGGNRNNASREDSRHGSLRTEHIMNNGAYLI